MSATEDSYDYEAMTKVLDRHCVMLREHFDSIHIVAVKRLGDDDATYMHSHGRGSWYERVGAMREAVLRADEGDRMRARGVDPDAED